MLQLDYNGYGTGDEWNVRKKRRYFFYDLKDIFAKSGASASDLDVLQGALDACLPYKAATPSFLSEFDIRTCCGLTMYLPSNGTPLLDKYYRKEAWNDATGLVQ